MSSGLPARDIRLTAEASSALKRLSNDSGKEAPSIVRRVRALRPILLADCLHGEVVKKAHIPKALARRYEIQNLYVEDLPSFWRLVYTVAKDRGDRYVVVLEIVDHRTYDKWFPGRKRR